MARRTGRLTASQAVVVAPGTRNAGLKPGTRQVFTLVKKSGWTNASPESLRPEWVDRMRKQQGTG